MAEKIADCDNGVSKIDVINCLVARERLGSTGIGNGIAIPHGRLKYCKKTIIDTIEENQPGIVGFNCLFSGVFPIVMDMVIMVEHG